MQLVKNILFEKFTQDSDPVSDMGIGMRAKISKWMKKIGQDDTNDNALAEAASYGKLDFVKFLVNIGANIHAWDDYALRYASENGYLEVVKFLVSQGADIHADNDYALRWASNNGHLEVVKFLVNSGTDIHVDNNIALRLASYNGHLEVVKFLVSKGADIHADNDCALRWARKKGHTNVVKFLESQMNKDKGIVKESLLEKFKQDSDPVSDMGIGMRTKISKWMKEIGEKDTDNNALAEAASHGKLDFVKFLVNHGANIHAEDNYALRWASKNGHFEVVKFLVSQDADIHADNNYALRWAKEKGHIDIVKFLESQMKKDKGIVKESLLEKFKQDSDPIKDMGIGLNMNRIIKQIIDHDYKKMIYVIEVTGAQGKNKQHLVGTYCKLGIYANDFYLTQGEKQKRMTKYDKIEYIKNIIKQANLYHLFYIYEFEHRSSTIINCRIMPEYKQYFKPGRYLIR